MARVNRNLVWSALTSALLFAQAATAQTLLLKDANERPYFLPTDGITLHRTSPPIPNPACPQGYELIKATHAIYGCQFQATAATVQSAINIGQATPCDLPQHWTNGPIIAQKPGFVVVWACRKN